MEIGQLGVNAQISVAAGRGGIPSDSWLELHFLHVSGRDYGFCARTTVCGNETPAIKSDGSRTRESHHFTSEHQYRVVPTTRPSGSEPTGAGFFHRPVPQASPDNASRAASEYINRLVHFTDGTSIDKNRGNPKGDREDVVCNPRTFNKSETYSHTVGGLPMGLTGTHNVRNISG